MSSPTYNVPLAGGRPSLRVPSPFSYNVNPLVSARKAPRSLSYTVPTCVQTAATSPGSVVLPPKEMPVQLASRPGSLAVPGPITPIQAKAVRPQGPPEKLTGGIPHPTSVEHQKTHYNRNLDEQAKAKEELLKMQAKQQVDFLHQAAEAQKKQALLQIEQQVRTQELQLNQEYSLKLMSMQQDLQEHKLVLERQASELVMDYHRLKSREDIMACEYEMQVKAYEDQVKIQEEIHASHAQSSGPRQPTLAYPVEKGAAWGILVAATPVAAPVTH